MLGVLLAAVGAAQLLIRGRGRPQQRCAEILRQIRSQGLQALWGPGAIDHWYLGRNETGRPISWRHVTRTPLGTGYTGTCQIGLHDGTVVQERWHLNADATAGEYESAERFLDTYIRFEDGTVIVHSNQRPARGSAPPNYIPEGLNSLVFFLAARGGQEVLCKMIFNSVAITEGREVYFSSMRLLPKDSNRLLVRHPLAPRDMVYQFDKLGFITRIEDPTAKIIYNRVPPAEVVRHFKQAIRYILPNPERL